MRASPERPQPEPKQHPPATCGRQARHKRTCRRGAESPGRRPMGVAGGQAPARSANAASTRASVPARTVSCRPPRKGDTGQPVTPSGVTRQRARSRPTPALRPRRVPRSRGRTSEVGGMQAGIRPRASSSAASDGGRSRILQRSAVATASSPPEHPSAGCGAGRREIRIRSTESPDAVSVDGSAFVHAKAGAMPRARGRRRAGP
jgi:hypothetical protein